MVTRPVHERPSLRRHCVHLTSTHATRPSPRKISTGTQSDDASEAEISCCVRSEIFVFARGRGTNLHVAKSQDFSNRTSFVSRRIGSPKSVVHRNSDALPRCAAEGCDALRRTSRPSITLSSPCDFRRGLGGQRRAQHVSLSCDASRRPRWATNTAVANAEAAISAMQSGTPSHATERALLALTPKTHR